MAKKSAILSVKNGQLRHTINAWLQDLLRQKVVEAILVMLTHEAGNTAVPSLVTDPSYLRQADVLAPVLPVNSARIVSAMTRLAPVTRRTAVILKPCELRALVELVKLKQAFLDNLVLIGVDCFGAYSVKDYAQLASAGTSQDWVKARAQGKEDPKLRLACQVCEYPVPLTADLAIGLVGVDLEGGLLLEANSEVGEDVWQRLGLSGEVDRRRETAISQLLSQRKKQRQDFFAQAAGEIAGWEKLLTIFAPCVNCHNCMTACPICYCKECFFESATFDLEGDRYLGLAEKRGALRMPTDTLLFHLTRMSHMAVSCVGCGSCEEACPNNIPLLKLFQLAGNRVQKLFDYIPGRSLADELPLAAFREEELDWIGGK